MFVFVGSTSRSYNESLHETFVFSVLRIKSPFKKKIHSTAAPESAVTLHHNKSRTLTPLSTSEIVQGQEQSKKHDDILEIALNKPTLSHTFNFRILPQITFELKQFYFQNIFVDITSVKEINRKTLGQRNNLWKIERRKRITASDAYRLFTYCKNKNPNWINKIDTYINPTNFESTAMKYGSKTEKEAFELYEKDCRVAVERLGFVISPILPWLGCSVDGFIPDLNKIIEFKCPVLGATQEMTKVLPTLKYLDENQRLKVNHMYYCQVQLGMAVLNATSCDFIVYCSFKKEKHVVTIPVDKNIIETYAKDLCYVYFTHLLPRLVQKKY